MLEIKEIYCLCELSVATNTNTVLVKPNDNIAHNMIHFYQMTQKRRKLKLINFLLFLKLIKPIIFGQTMTSLGTLLDMTSPPTAGVT